MDAIGSTGSSAMRNEFLQLLVTQMRNQDPLDPIKQQDFLGQLAQFSTLEGVENLNSNFSDMLAVQQEMLKQQQFTQGASLLGRDVSFQAEAADASSEGRVQAIDVVNGSLFLNIDGATVPIGNVGSVLS